MTTLKRFDASKFVSNEKTPVCNALFEPIHVLSTQGKGTYSVIGYLGDHANVLQFDPGLIFFYPIKRTVEVDVFLHRGGAIVFAQNESECADTRRRSKDFRFLGTIKGEVDA